jgi:hypothetical protein
MADEAQFFSRLPSEAEAPVGLGRTRLSLEVQSVIDMGQGDCIRQSRVADMGIQISLVRKKFTI